MKMDKKENHESFLVMIDQIETALSCDLLLPALALALTIPDTCGKVEFPEIKGRRRYIKWFDKYIGDEERIGNFIPINRNSQIISLNPVEINGRFYNEVEGVEELEELEYIDYPYLSGEVVYKLRCMYLHEGKHEPENDITGISHFELKLDNNKTGIYHASASTSTILSSDENESEIFKTMSISVRELCFKICVKSRKYYNENKKLFNNQDYNVTYETEDESNRVLPTLIREIRTANKCGLNHLALSTALQLPDICAQVDKDTKKLETSEKYRSWYKTHIESKELKKYECNENKDIIPPFVVTAKNAYKLRCNYLHSGVLSNKKNPHSSDFKIDENSDTNIQLIEVYYDVNSENSRSATLRTKENSITPIRLNAKEYSEMICSRVEEYYSQNAELFEDLNYSLYAMSDQYQLFKE